MYTDIHSVLFQFAFNQQRFMVIHGLCCWSQSNPCSGPRRFTADRAVNYQLQWWRSRITQRAYKFSAQQFKGQPSVNCSSAQPSIAHLICWLRKYINSQLIVLKGIYPWQFNVLIFFCQSWRPGKKGLALKGATFVIQSAQMENAYFFFFFNFCKGKQRAA